MDNTFNKLKNLKEVEKYVLSLVPVFFLQGWEISVVHGKNKKEIAAAECFTRERYRQCQITIFKSFWSGSEEEQKHTIVHELCHNITGIQNALIHSLLNGEKSTEGEMLESFERETSWMANIIWKLLKK